MTVEQLRGMLALWKHRLGLDSWWIELEVGGDDLDATDMMCVVRSTLYQRARVHVAPWLLGRCPPPPDVLTRNASDEQIEASLVHELLHLWTRDMRNVVESDLDGFLHRDVHTQVTNAIRRAEEQTVDALAVALVRAWPR